MKGGSNVGERERQEHITPANLLGLCFVILSFIKLMKVGAETVIDEMVSVAVVIFLIASLFSYASIRSKANSEKYERIADIVFLGGPALLTVIAIITAFEII